MVVVIPDALHYVYVYLLAPLEETVLNPIGKRATTAAAIDDRDLAEHNN